MATITGMEKITFGKGIPGYVCGSVKDPAVVVLQEWWGVVPTVVDHAINISQHGYRCLIPDLYKGKVGVDKEEASHLMNSLDWATAVEEMKAAVQYLRDDGASKVGCIGFCMGGALALAAAQHAGVDCTAPCYGTPSPELCQPENVKVPVQMHFGELDDFKGFSDQETAKAFADKVNAAGGAAALFMYAQAGHGFLNRGDEGVAKRAYMGFPEPPSEAQALAWERVLAFFEENLKAK